MIDQLTRRQFVLLIGAASAAMAGGCSTPAPAASPTANPVLSPTAASVAPKPTAPSASATAAPTNVAPVVGKPASGAPAEWDALVASARAEGRVVIHTPAGAGYRPALDAFALAFPGIVAEQQAFPDSATFIPKITNERKAGIYNLDAAATTIVPILQIAKPGGWLEPLRPALILPEITDDKSWIGGYEARWADLSRTHVFKHQIVITRSVFINTNLVQEGEIKSLDDLLDPKWKGKIVSSEVTQGGIYTASTVIREQRGEAFLKKLFVDQEPLFIRDRRQAIETFVRGGGAICLAPQPIIMADFIAQGLASHIKNPDVLIDPSHPIGTGYLGSDIVALYSQAPHPNAAKVFANWSLSKAGQIAWSTSLRLNSARSDVTIQDPSSMPGKVDYIDPTDEPWLPKLGETQDFLKKLG